jgi:6-phosphogluconate dehydrogenase
MKRERLADFGIVGLGRIGGGLARQALEKGLRVAGYSKGGVPPKMARAGVVAARSLAGLAARLRKPRVILLYIPAGTAVDLIINELLKLLSHGDVIVDGGNSYWGDSIRRAARVSRQGIQFVDVGTSGGVDGARRGACFMVGGSRRAVGVVAPVLKRLAVKGGFVHAGASGSGHFVKLVHNGIEFGMLQAIGEGVDLLERFPTPLPVAQVLESWRHGSVIRSWLIELAADQYQARRGLKRTPALVEDTGEVNWLVDDALRLEVPIPVIALSVMQLLASRDGRKNWARAIAMMRHGFGGHPFGRDATIARERHESRVGEFASPPRIR